MPNHQEGCSSSNSLPLMTALRKSKAFPISSPPLQTPCSSHLLSLTGSSLNNSLKAPGIYNEQWEGLVGWSQQADGDVHPWGLCRAEVLGMAQKNPTSGSGHLLL